MNYDFVDFKPYYKPEDVDNYELFIGPNGEYYKVKTTYESDENCTHYYWAIGYFQKKGIKDVLMHKNIEKKCKTELEVLINLYGFIRYTHAYGKRDVYINLPNPDYFGVVINSKQKTSLYKIMEFNHDNITSDIIEHNNESNCYEEKRDKIFQRIISK